MTKDEVIQRRIELRAQIIAVQEMQATLEKMCDQKISDLDDQLEQLQKDCSHGEMDYHPEPECLWCWRTWL